MYSEHLSHKAVDVADKNPVILDESTNLADAARLMRKKQLSSVLVGRDSQHVIGIVTERDILYRVVAESRGPFKTTLKEIRSSPLITVDEATPVKDAIAVMRRNAIRRVPVLKEGQVVGILTLKSIMGNNHNESIELAEVEIAGDRESKVMCPYCQSRFSNKEELSKHIDRLHLGSGLLEGDLRKW
ncbi:MAG: zinc finger protein [Nitrososphaera sp.]|jgi:signal-transduction protein with cAMP-binding, CBS, and nucleotidyltransferase domain|nr:zinc finger protein [Nitrososphaera sp.]